MVFYDSSDSYTGIHNSLLLFCILHSSRFSSVLYLLICCKACNVGFVVSLCQLRYSLFIAIIVQLYTHYLSVHSSEDVNSEHDEVSKISR